MSVTETPEPVPTGQPHPGRGSELALTVLAVLISVLAYAAVGIAVDGVLPSGTAGYGAGLGTLFLLAHLVVRRVAPYADPLILPCVALLNGLGVVVIRRLDFASGSSEAPRQLIWTAVGVAAFAVLLLVVRDHASLQRYTYTAAAVGLALLLLPALPGIGRTINGARLWIRVGPLQVQPSEVSKLLLILFFAGYLVAKRDVLSLASRRVLGLDLPRGRDLGPVLVAWAASLAVLIRGKDLGSSLLFFAIFVVMLYIATERTSWLVIGVALFLGGSFVAYLAFGHVQRRVDTWLHPFADPDNDGFQLVQSLFGFGTGGLTGTGSGRGPSGRRPVRQHRLHHGGHRRRARTGRRHGGAAAVRADRRARPARRAVVPRLLRQAARRRLVVRPGPAGLRHRRRGHRPHPADRRDAALAVLRRLQRRLQLGARRAAAAHQRRRAPAGTLTGHPDDRPGGAGLGRDPGRPPTAERRMIRERA